MPSMPPTTTLPYQNITLPCTIAGNYSNITLLPITGEWTPHSASGTVIMTAFIVFLILVTLFGNGLVVGIFYSYKPLRTVTNYFIVSLAVADILVAALSMPIWIAYIHVGLSTHGYGHALYRLWICVDITSGVSSVLNLSFVSVDRYIHIMFPLRYESIITEKRAVFILIGVWLYAGGLASIKGIAFNWARPNYEILVSVMGFLLPFSVMVWCYHKIFKAARQHAKVLKNGQRRELGRDFKAAKTIAVVILAFFLCWCPFFLLNLCFGLLPEWRVPGVLINVAKWLHYTNSALNPLIYACLNEAYRSAFKALLTKKKLQRSFYTNARRESTYSPRTKEEFCIIELISRVTRKDEECDV